LLLRPTPHRFVLPLNYSRELFRRRPITCIALSSLDVSPYVHVRNVRYGTAPSRLLRGH